MNFSKVITHDGVFHADEVFAVALLMCCGFDFHVIRTRDPKLLAHCIVDPNTLVADVGGVLNPSNLNFDHHQDAALPSAAGLVYEHFKEAQPFFAEFIASIDAVDTNRNNIHGLLATLPCGFRTTSAIISGFNRDPKDAALQDEQFSEAVKFAIYIISNEIVSATTKAKAEQDYVHRQILPNNVCVFSEHNMIWRTKGEHLFAVMPNESGWIIQTRDTSIAVVPESVSECDGFIFRHASGFMAIVKDKQTAIEFAEKL